MPLSHGPIAGYLWLFLLRLHDKRRGAKPVAIRNPSLRAQPGTNKDPPPRRSRFFFAPKSVHLNLTRVTLLLGATLRTLIPFAPSATSPHLAPAAKPARESLLPNIQPCDRQSPGQLWILRLSSYCRPLLSIVQFMPIVTPEKEIAFFSFWRFGLMRGRNRSGASRAVCSKRPSTLIRPKMSLAIMMAWSSRSESLRHLVRCIPCA